MARVNFPLHHYRFEIHRWKLTITAVQVREIHADGQTAANMFDPMSIVTNVNCEQKRKSSLASCDERVFSGNMRTDRKKCQRRELWCAQRHTYHSTACAAIHFRLGVACIDSREHGSSLPFSTSSRLVAAANYLALARQAERIREWRRDDGKESIKRRSREEKES